MNTASTFEGKNLTLAVRARITHRISVRDEVQAMTHSCGQSVAGRPELVVEAHRQHLLHCPDAWRR